MQERNGITKSLPVLKDKRIKGKRKGKQKEQKKLHRNERKCSLSPLIALSPYFLPLTSFLYCALAPPILVGSACALHMLHRHSLLCSSNYRSVCTIACLLYTSPSPRD